VRYDPLRRREWGGIHEVIGADQRLAKAVRILVGEILAVEAGIGGVNDAVVVRAKNHDVSADIWAAQCQVLNVMGLGKGDAIIGEEILAAHLAAVFVVRFEAVGEELIAHELLNVHRPPGYRVQDSDAIVVVNRREGALLAKFLGDP
jgi:hypothetical protein